MADIDDLVQLFYDKKMAIRDTLLIGALFLLASTAPAYAYLDPGTGSIVLQAVIGGVAASLFILRGYYQKIKSLLGVGRRAARRDETPRE